MQQPITYTVHITLHHMHSFAYINITGKRHRMMPYSVVWRRTHGAARTVAFTLVRHRT